MTSILLVSFILNIQLQSLSFEKFFIDLIRVTNSSAEAENDDISHRGDIHASHLVLSDLDLDYRRVLFGELSTF